MMSERTKAVSDGLNELLDEIKLVIRAKPTKADMIANMDYWSNLLQDYINILNEQE